MPAKKRANGEGTISQYSDGRWCARIMLPTGKRKAVYGTTRKEVAQKLTSLNRDRDQGLPILAERQTCEKYLEHWLTDTAQHTLRPRTYTRYGQLVRKHALPAIGKTILARLTPQQISALYADRLASGLSPRTVQFLHSVLHRALKQAVLWNLLGRNPTDAVQAPRPKRPEITPLTPEQANVLLDAAQGDPLEALYVLALMTGMRQGELLALRWDAIDWAASRLEVRHTISTVAGGGWVLSDPKTGRSRRSIKLPPTALAALKCHRARQAEQRLAVGAAWQDHGFVFTTAIGSPVKMTATCAAAASCHCSRRPVCPRYASTICATRRPRRSWRRRFRW